ncbi:MAG: hypothetical protein IPJ65_11585 [Archangiaceae bacterium]|nr:hypothetical protein [Archangiaceae bacterium]
MTETPRWLETRDTEAARLVALTAAVEPRSLDVAAGWRQVLIDSGRPRRSWLLIPAWVASMALGALLVLWLWPHVAPSRFAPTVEAASDARWSQKADEVVLEAGRLSLRAPRSGALMATTPHVRLEVVRGRVAADVTSSHTALRVESGETVVRAAERVWRLGAGDAMSWPVQPDIAPQLLGGAPPLGLCEASAPAQLVDCLELESRGAGMRAEAALYELGALRARQGRREAALDAWRASLARFPTGVLHPEVRLALLLELIAAERYPEAIRVAHDFEAACPDDARVGDVARLRKSVSRQ